ncbi:MAG: cardiolipin synthase [Ruminococcaceae bacterium]|nr:cardiolipin synthase [Oscillospiraceae bacterium]
MSRRNDPGNPAFRTRARRYINRHFHIIFQRMVYVLLFATIQIAFFVWLFVYMTRLTPLFLVICALLSLLAAMHVINKNSNPAIKIAWLIPLFTLPIFGGLLYLMFGYRRVNRRLTAVTEDIRADYRTAGSNADGQIGGSDDSPVTGAPVPIDEDTVAAQAPRDAALQSAYIARASGCLPFSGTDTTYYPSGTALFGDLCEALRSSKRYIFLEYFIIEEGVFWDTVLDILTERAAAGVEVRVMYDDFGSMLTLPLNYERFLRERGIRAHVFNPFNTVLSPRPNNRDHRKITVVDGVVAFLGGINLADEYIGVYEKHGQWKDTAVRLTGDGAWGVAIQFLAVWDADTKSGTDLQLYCPQKSGAPAVENGIVQPYTDIPMDNEQVGETVYFQMITRAERYIYITTPYLIIDHELLVALQTAAKSGVDVRIVTPHIPDKKSVFLLTRSYYKPLLDAGVKIYEYTPGFIHAKSMVTDDRFAVVGSINFDYRSLYLHLENAVWMYNTSAVTDVRDDILDTITRSEEIHEDVLGRMTLGRRLWLSILRTFSPLM